MYVNITEPYYYFNIFDPEGNTIEICSNFEIMGENDGIYKS